jgi:hypothetical protein
MKDLAEKVNSVYENVIKIKGVGNKSRDSK